MRFRMGAGGMLGAFEELVLLAVGRERTEAYGMTVRREIEERTGREVTIGAVYTTLDRLETKGLLLSTIGASDASRSGRARRYFRLTAEGVEALQRVRDARDGLWKGIDLQQLAADAEGTS